MDREPLGDVTNRKIESPKEKQRRERDVGRKAVNSFKNYIGRLKEKQFSNFKLSVNANIRLIDRWTDQTILASGLCEDQLLEFATFFLIFLT